MIGKNTLIQILITALIGLVNFFFVSFSARLFGPNIIGEIAYLFSLTGLIFAFSDLGLSRAHGFYTASSKKPGKNLFTFLSLKTTLLFFSAFIAFLYVYFFHSSSSWLLLGLIILIEILTRFSSSILITFEALQQALPQNLVRLATKLVRLSAVIIIAGFLKTNLGYSLAYLIEAGLLIFLSLILMTKLTPFSFSKKLANKYLIYSLPFFAIIPLSYFQDNSLIVILKNLQSAQEVGYYSASFNLASAVKTLYATLMLFFFPKISRLFSEKNQSQIQSYLNMAVRYLLVIFTPVFILLFTFRHLLISLILGPQFLPAIPVFSWLLLGIFILMTSAPYDHVLFATKNHRPLVIVNLVGLLAAVSLSFWLVPAYGAIGTVIAAITAWFIAAAWHLALVKSRLNLHLLPQFLPIVVPAVIIIFLLNYPQTLVLKLALSLVLIPAYYLLLWQLKIITKLDIKYLKSIVKVK